MGAFALNEHNDIYFKNGDIAIIPGNNTDEEIAQRIKIRLQFFQGEWYLNTAHGVPYFPEIFGTKDITSNAFDSFMQEQILDVEGVTEILQTKTDYDTKQRKLFYEFKVVTINSTSIIDNIVTNI